MLWQVAGTPDLALVTNPDFSLAWNLLGEPPAAISRVSEPGVIKERRWSGCLGPWPDYWLGARHGRFSPVDCHLGCWLDHSDWPIVIATVYQNERRSH
jgi:hypothetical protein